MKTQDFWSSAFVAGVLWVFTCGGYLTLIEHIRHREYADLLSALKESQSAATALEHVLMRLQRESESFQRTLMQYGTVSHELITRFNQFERDWMEVSEPETTWRLHIVQQLRDLRQTNADDCQQVGMKPEKFESRR